MTQDLGEIATESNAKNTPKQDGQFMSLKVKITNFHNFHTFRHKQMCLVKMNF